MADMIARLLLAPPGGRVITQLLQLRQEMVLLADAERHATRVPTWAQLPAASES